MARQFEYKVLEIIEKIEESQLNKLGLEGWELVSIIPAIAGAIGSSFSIYFKRMIPIDFSDFIHTSAPLDFSEELDKILRTNGG